MIIMKSTFMIGVFYFVYYLLILSNLAQSTSSSSTPPNCKAWLVQSIPTNMPHLSHVPGVLPTAFKRDGFHDMVSKYPYPTGMGSDTHSDKTSRFKSKTEIRVWRPVNLYYVILLGDVLRWMAANSTKRLDIIAQYWQLLASPNDTRSGDYGYSQHQMQEFGAHQGAALYQALDDAANRNVHIRLLSHSGVYPDYTLEPSKLASGRPNVENVTLLLDDWWGSGIVHAKVWISDSRDVYIGSANNDWKSLTQVKEVGIYFAGCPEIAKKVESYFDNLWMLASLNSSDYTKTVVDQQWQVERKVPCWSHFIDPTERCKSPLPPYVETPHVAGYPILSDPYMFEVSIQTPGSNYSTMLPQLSYLSFAPPELLFGKYQADEQAWIDTIKSVRTRGTVRINTMDWLGQSEFTDQTIFWSSLSSAISEVVFSKHATVKILVACWAHNIENTDQYLKSLLYTNNLCSSSKYNNCSSKVEIKYYVVPGFNMTGPAIQGGGARTGNIYPSFTRVNHGKYAVSDVRAHIGTSNLVWDYFYTTAGVSFGTYSIAIVSQLREIFDADWNSPYSVPVQELEKGLDCSI